MWCVWEGECRNGFGDMADVGWVVLRAGMGGRERDGMELGSWDGVQPSFNGL